MKSALILVGCCCLGPLAGCAVNGGGQSCYLTDNLSVSPSSATADHTLSSPGNQARFQAFISPSAPPGCAVPAWIAEATPTWTSSQPTAIQIDSSSNPSTNGTATCVTATDGSATLTATVSFNQQTLTQTATLTCK